MPLPTASDDLTAAHRAIHVRLEALYYEVLEALTDLKLDTALARFGVLSRTLLAHGASEDQHVLPRYAAFAPESGPAAVASVAGDHVILARRLSTAGAALAALGELTPLTRAAMVRRLRPFVALFETLDHHTIRETDEVYPRLQAQLDAAARHALIVALESAVADAQKEPLA